VVERTLSVVLWQVPIVAVAAAIAWVALPADWAALEGPLLLLSAAFVLGFPLRVFPAVLQGLQEIVYVAAQTIVGWALGFLTTVALVLAGAGLYALVAGWIAVQAYTYAAAWYRLTRRYPTVLPRRLPRFRWGESKSLLESAAWVSASQVAYVLLAGSDVLVVGWVLGKAAATPYAVTARLVMVLAMQPQTIMNVALPAISEIRGGADMERLRRVSTTLTQATLWLSGLIFCVVLVVNEPFVRWWVGAETEYGGDTLTALLLVAMVLRHLNQGATQTLFALGGERRISLTALADGVVSIVAAIVLVSIVGPVGAAMASILGVVAVSLPANLIGLRRAGRIAPGAWMRPLLPWAWRFVVAGAGAAAVSRIGIPATLPALVATTLAVGLIVGLWMIPAALEAPLGEYVRPRVRALARRF
jgi:O-antigen/teichoic acid export membrane protein